jgi:hemolysin III
MEEFTPEQERVNANTHFLALGLGLILIPILVVVAATNPEVSREEFVSILIYGAGFLLVFCFSALYHRFSNPKRKRLMEKLDHIGINFMIAGTYTPFVMAYAPPGQKWWLLSIIWSLASAGSIFNSIYPDRFRIVSMLFYIAMGLTVFYSPAEFQRAIPEFQMSWLTAGAVIYISGLAFYLRAFFKHHHAIWHVFVLGGALCHFVAIAGILN